LTLGLLAGPSLSDTGDMTVPIVISPSTINIEHEGVWVTVHAEIPYVDVVGATVTLDGVEVELTFADSRGELVAKFCVDDVKSILVNDEGTVINPTPTLTLHGLTDFGDEFTGTDMIRVIKVSGKK
jgi:hypothetical protein